MGAQAAGAVISLGGKVIKGKGTFEQNIIVKGKNEVIWLEKFRKS